MIAVARGTTARSLFALAFALALVPSGPASAVDPTPPECPSPATAVPPELFAWANQAPLMAAAKPATLDAATVTVGTAYRAELQPPADIDLGARPEKPDKPATTPGPGGLFKLDIAAAGTYRIALGSRGSIDIVPSGPADATPLQPAGHAEGKACSGIRKTVDFALQPGSYVLQLSGSDTPVAGLLVVKLP